MLVIQNVTKDIGKKTVLNDIKFHVSPGEVVGLLGPNGAGKTTTIKIITGLLTPSHGLISADDHDLASDKAEYVKKIGYVPDNPFFYDELTGMEFIRFTSELRGLAVDLENIRTYARVLGAEDFLSDRIDSYSLGMKRKLSLLVSFMHRPTYLVMDEPFNGLDPITTINIKGFLRQYTSSGGGVLISTHLLDIAERFCTKIVVILDGYVVAFDSTSKLTQEGAESLEDMFLRLTKTEEGAANQTC